VTKQLLVNGTKLGILVVCLIASAQALRAQDSTRAADDVRGEIVEILSTAWDLDSTANAVWPGFSIRHQVLFLTYSPAGPTGMIGDPDPPRGFDPAPADPRVHILEGPVPDTLAGLRIGRTWDGRLNAATSYPVRERQPPDQVLRGVIHEVFHAFQQDRPGFEARPTAHLDMSRDYAWLTAVEGRLLSEALSAPSISALRDRALEAVAVRQHKCTSLKETDCARESDLEIREGSANYVANAVLIGSGRHQEGDSLAARLQRAPSREALERGWYYLTGEAWFQLIDRISSDRSWTGRLQEGNPEDLLLDIMAVDKDNLSDVADRVLKSRLASVTAQQVDSAMSAAQSKADSVVSTFDGLSGTRVKILIAGGWCGASTSRGGDWHLVDGVSYALEKGEWEVRYGSGTTWYKAEGAMRDDAGSLTIVVPGRLSAQTATGVTTLDRPGLGLAGPMEISAENLEVHAENATIVTTEEEVRVILHGDGGGDACRTVKRGEGG
jgi:hypothetical protein